MESIASDRAPEASRRTALLWTVLAAMVLGVGTGWLLAEAGLSDAAKADTVACLNVVVHVFLRLIRMVVAPLILSILVVGIADMGGAGKAGRMTMRSLAWFLMMSMFAIAIGLVLANVFTPGASLGLALPSAAGADAPSPDFSAIKAIEEMAPTSIIEAMSTNKVIQIVVFAVFAGVGLSALGPKGAAIRELANATVALMLRVAGYVMRAAPIVVFCALAATTLEHGLAMVAILGAFVAEFYLGLVLMTVVILAAGSIVLGRRVVSLLGAMREPLLIAFSTASSEATYPAAISALERQGVPSRICGLVLPLGYAFNLDGSLVFASFSALFIAQAYGVHLSLTTQLGLMAFLLLANKGAAGVPRGGLIGLAVTLQAFDIPVAGVALILGVDAIMDMGRTTVNVLGNAVATASIARIEGELLPEREIDDVEDSVQAPHDGAGSPT